VLPAAVDALGRKPLTLDGTGLPFTRTVRADAFRRSRSPLPAAGLRAIDALAARWRSTQAVMSNGQGLADHQAYTGPDEIGWAIAGIAPRSTMI
jgi:hypothetical protein